MALTVAHRSRSEDVSGRHRTRHVVVTFDSSYPTGGESFTPADVGLAEFDIVLVSPDSNAAGGHTVQYDYTAKKFKVYVEEAVAAGGPLLEIANATDLSTLVIRVLCIGN